MNSHKESQRDGHPTTGKARFQAAKRAERVQNRKAGNLLRAARNEWNNRG